jgi:hypothetical protein
MRPPTTTSWAAAGCLALGLATTAFAQTDETDIEKRYDALEKQHPSLYTGDYGDCLGGESLFNITKYDAAYYRKDKALLFQMNGATSVREENVIRKCRIRFRTALFQAN